MRDSIVNIESVSNNSFGTGFVIDSDEKGVYLLTCQHVLDDVETPVVENVLARVIAKGGFIDMAVLYVSKLHLEPLPLQTKECDQLDVEVIGFSHFNRSLIQKKQIRATLYQELIELHSKEEEAYYNVRKIKANDGFTFDRGNSGSPVICKSSGNVIAMISNKEGNDIGYAIDIVNLKEIWKDAPSRLFEKPRAIIEPVSGTKDEAPKQRESTTLNSTPKSNSSVVKYLIALAIVLGVGFGAYTALTPKGPKKSEILAREKEAKEAEIKRQQEIKAKEEAERKRVADEKDRFAKEKEARLREAQKEAEKKRQQEEEAKKKHILAKTLKYEKAGFKALMDKEYSYALRLFSYANRLKPKFHHLPDITLLLEKNIHSMNNFVTKRKVLNEILKKYSKYAPKGFVENIKDQIKLSIFKTPEISHRTPVIKRAEEKIVDLKEKVREQPKLNLRNRVERVTKEE
jgi:hypothetical protein